MREISEDEDLGKFSFSSSHFLYPFRGQLMKTSKDSTKKWFEVRANAQFDPFFVCVRFVQKMTELVSMGINNWGSV
jgi:hypothetical protein